MSSFFGDKPQSRRGFLRASTPAALGGLWFGAGCDSTPTAPEQEEWARDDHGWIRIEPHQSAEGSLFAKPAGASPPGYRAVVTRLYWELVRPPGADPYPSAWDLLNARRMGAVAEQTTLGPQVQSIRGIGGSWCCTIGRTWPGSSGRSVVSRLGAVSISSDRDFNRHIRRFRGTIGVSLDPDDRNRTEENTFGLFAPIHPPATSGPFYVCWLLSERFNVEGARAYS